MNLKEIQKQTVREEFIHITKEMIIREGADGVSVRKIADIANCSYATLYNYFRDMNDLLWHVVAALMRDMESEFQDIESQNSYDIKDLKTLCRRYFEYFCATPHLFTFFFFRDIGLPPPELAGSVSPPFVVHLAMRILDLSLREASQGEIASYCGLITEALHGKMMFVFSNKEDLPPQEIKDSIDTMVDLILRPATGGA
mgnify:CR=1 FL=1